MSKVAKAVIGQIGNMAAGKVPVADAHLKRFLFVVLVDVSGSTAEAFKGNPPDIHAINDALPLICKALREPRAGTPLARVHKQLDLAIVAYSHRIQEILPWTLATKLQASFAPLTPEGGTATGAALEHVQQMIHARQTELRASKTPLGMPHIIHVTDGGPTDMQPGDAKWNAVQARLAKVGGMQGLESIKTAAIMHFVTPNGCDPDFIGNQIFAASAGQTGMERLGQLSGAASVHPVEEGGKLTETLVELVTATIINVSSLNMPANEAAKAATKKAKEGKNDSTIID
ncbi:MAG: vWA domain-containing protein [Hyphomicrobiaceae bacterium]